ncbi:MAG TPA: FAD binding domain-containing protein [Gaiellaceae bacterium]|nr:FAD binding domain-containing protein [Gaiellaceae bacterium]
MSAVTDVLIPASPDEAVSAYGDGSGVTVIGGGTIVMPDITAGRLSPAKTILLARAGLAAVTRDGGKVTLGAMTPLQQLVDLGAPVGPCAANVADLEVRLQGTVGGNLCAGQGQDAPRGDLQGALIAVGAQVRSVGAGGERAEPVEDFLAGRAGRLVLDVTYDEPAAGAFVAIDRPHTHEYTTLAVSAAKLADGTIRLAATGTGTGAARLPSAEAAAADPEAAGAAALKDVTLHDDVLASAWYREQALPVLVRRALTRLEEGR